MKKPNSKSTIISRIREKRNYRTAKRTEERKRKKKIFIPEDGSTKSPLLSFLFSKLRSETKNIESVKGTTWIDIPKTFSFIRNPERSISVIRRAVTACRDRKINKIVLDHTACEHLDLGASMVLDIAFLEHRKEKMFKKRKTILGGHLPENTKVLNLLQCTGILHHLRIDAQKPPNEVEDNYYRFPLRKGHRLRYKKNRSTDQETTATELAQYFKECFYRYGWRLSEDGQSYLLSLSGEVIDNAERHSQKNLWWTMAYLEQDHEINKGRCHISFLSFGKTIYQTMQKISPNSKLRIDIEKLTDRHRKRGFFSSSVFTEENLWTLYALQDGVTSSGKAGGGIGTIKMIETFLDLADSISPDNPPEMAIVSGSTQILFNNKYRLKHENINGELRSIIAFNPENSLDSKPDKRNVRPLKSFFPGTIISLSFTINPSCISKN